MNRYVLLEDTFGGGLVQFNDELDIYDGEDELKCGILQAAEELEDSFDMLDGFDTDAICIALLVDNVNGIPCSDYITQVIKGNQEMLDKEEYELYLKLKDKYDG